MRKKKGVIEKDNQVSDVLWEDAETSEDTETPAEIPEEEQGKKKKIKTKKKKGTGKKKKIIILVVAVVVLGVGGYFVYSRTQKLSAMKSRMTKALSYTVSKGDVSTTVSGTGTLAYEDAENIDVLDGIKIKKVYVEAGNEVKKGDTLASVDKTSVLSVMADIQDQIDTLDDDIEDKEDDTDSSKITAGVTGRIKKIYVSSDDKVADVMNSKGALMLLSMDGKMAVDLDDVTGLSVGDSVKVTLSDSSTVTGTVAEADGSSATITVTDKGTGYNEAVSVSNSDGKVIGSGNLYIHSELKVTGYSGTVDSIDVSTGEYVDAGDTLIELDDLGHTAEYEELVSQRSDLAEALSEATQIYQSGIIKATFDGTIQSVNISDNDKVGDTSSSTTSSSSTSSGSSSTTGTATNQSTTNMGMTASTLTASGQIAATKTIATGLQNTGLKKTSSESAEVLADSGTTESTDDTATTTGNTTETTGSTETTQGGSTTSTQDAASTTQNGASSTTQEATTSTTSKNGTTAAGGQTTKQSGSGAGMSGSGSAGTASVSGSSTTSSSTSTETTSEESVVDRTTAFTESSNDKMEVSVSVDELDILSVKEDQEAAVTIDAIGTDTFTGTVSSISSVASTQDGGNTKYTATVLLDRTDDMMVGMNASIVITISSASDVLIIPESAVNEDGESTYVYTTEDEESGELSGKTEITTGSSDGNNVEVKSGLSEGDTIYYTQKSTSDSEESSEDNNMMKMGNGNRDGGQMPSGGGGMPSGGGPGSN